jgi:hypothetical protein
MRSSCGCPCRGPKSPWVQTFRSGTCFLLSQSSNAWNWGQTLFRSIRTPNPPVMQLGRQGTERTERPHRDSMETAKPRLSRYREAKNSLCLCRRRAHDIAGLK